ncbi:MAG TPA: hypothetical protein VNA17_08585 [Pyrinomonadaceae bacterium]|nr:hypothetical protein [Pyrinomonadaceae bacterium]
MKRCPECRKDYFDDRLLYCLDDGAALIQGSITDEPATAIWSGGAVSGEGRTGSLAGGDARFDTARTGQATSRFFARKWLPWILAALFAGLTVGLAIYVAKGPQSSAYTAPLRRFRLEIPSKLAPNWTDFRVAVSPDGSKIVYNCREGNTVNLCLRSLDSLSSHRLTEGREAEDWAFSHDGEWIAIQDNVGLSKVSVRGGQPQIITRWDDNTPPPDGFSWGPDGQILFGSGSGLKRVAAAGGAIEQVTRVASDAGINGHFFPSYLPDGKSALITIEYTDGTDRCGLVDLRDGSVRELGVQGSNFTYIEDGWLVFKQGDTLMAAPFDGANSTRAVNPVPVIENVRGSPAIGRDGTLVYVPTRGESTARLVWVDRAGNATPIPVERLDYSHLDLAPDDRQALLNLDDGNVYRVDLGGGTRKLVATGSFPTWSPDGKRIIFRGQNGLQSESADGSSPLEILVPKTGFVVPTSVNERTGELAYYDHRAFEIWIRSTDGQTRRFLGGPGRKRSGRFSRDGNWLAFVSDETGENQVYVTAYPGPGPTVAVSTKGGLSPIWASDGKELFFRLGTKMLSARLSGIQPLKFEPPVELFDGPYTLDLLGHQREDVTTDGKRFLMVENSDDFPIVIVQNWLAELRQVVR